MKNKLTNNLGMRVLAVLIAVLIWIIVVNVSDPIIESTYSGVPVEIINADAIAKQNKTFEVLDDTDVITVTISAKRTINDLLGRENIKATADFSDLDLEKGTVRIKLETNKYNDKIESIKGKNDVLRVEIENLQKRQLAITPQVNGEPEEGYVIGDTTLEQNVVTVQGPESLVSLIDKAVVEASVSGMSTSISTTSAIRYYDAEGNLLDASRLNGNISTVNLKVDVLATKMMGFRFYTTGTPANDYMISGDITSDIEEVKVAGKPSALAVLSSINVPAAAIDVEGKDETFTVAIDLFKYMPDNIMIVDKDFDGKINVTVPMAKLAKRDLKIPGEQIEFTGLDSKKQTISLDNKDDIVISVKGLSDDVYKVDAEDLTVEVSIKDYLSDSGLKKLEAGVYKLPLSIQLPEGVELIGDDPVVECRIRDLDS